MSGRTEELIASLASDARPVGRLMAPAARAAIWLALLLAIGAAIVVLWADIPEVLRRNAGIRPMLAWTACLLTGISAIVAAAFLATPDRSRRWALAPLPFLIGWLALSGIGCLGLEPEPQGDSGMCFAFVMLAGLPTTTFLLWRLQRGRPLDAWLTMGMGALGAAGLAAALLQFFHPFPITLMDLGVHLAAVALIVAGGGLAGRILGRR